MPILERNAIPSVNKNRNHLFLPPLLLPTDDQKTPYAMQSSSHHMLLGREVVNYPLPTTFKLLLYVSACQQPFGTWISPPIFVINYLLPDALGKIWTYFYFYFLYDLTFPTLVPIFKRGERTEVTNCCWCLEFFRPG